MLPPSVSKLVSPPVERPTSARTNRSSVTWYASSTLELRIFGTSAGCRSTRGWTAPGGTVSLPSDGFPCAASPRVPRHGARASDARWRTLATPAASAAPLSEEDREPEFPFVLHLISILRGDHDMSLVFGAQEEAAADVISEPAPHVRRLLGTVRGLDQRGFRLDVQHPDAEHQEGAEPPLRHRHVGEADV